ncbi:MAG: DNA polymerase [Actinomycetes bacterium]|jgi:hypothetical protein
MKLSESTLAVLKNFASINPNIKITEGNTLSTISSLKTLLSKATITDNFEKTFCIYDLNRFLSTLSLFKDPDLEFGDSAVIIKGGRQKITYRYCDEKVIVAAPAKEIQFPAAEVQFELTQEALSAALKATGVLGLPEIAFVGEGGKLYLRAVNSKDVGSDEFSEEVGETTQEFTAVFKPEYLSKIFPASYKVEVSSKKISRFTNDNVVYWIATESNSTFA